MGLNIQLEGTKDWVRCKLKEITPLVLKLF